MAVGKNKRLTKGGKKGTKKKIVDPFTRKDWYDVKAPSTFAKRQVGKTLVNRSAGTRIASDSLKGRVFEVCLSDIHDSVDSFRKFKLIVEEVQGKTCLTNFHGMDVTRDMLFSKIRKWHSTIEAHADVKTTDGYLLRLFCIGFTMGDPKQIKTTAYAKHTQIKAIRRKMIEIMIREVSSSNLREVVDKLKPDSIAKDIEKTCKCIYPIHDVYIRKVKVLRKPKFDISRLLYMHGESSSVEVDGKDGVRMDRPDHYEPPIQESV